MLTVDVKFVDGRKISKMEAKEVMYETTFVSIITKSQRITFTWSAIEGVVETWEEES